MPVPFLPETLYAVIGWPLGQSLSPLLHNTGFQTLGIPASYMRFAVTPQELGTFVDSVRLLHMGGVSVTIPHKETIIPLLDGLTPRARSVGAVNTLYWDENNHLMGDNTDITGFLAPLEQTDLRDTPVLVLGAGGAARAIVCGLRERGCDPLYIATPSNKSHLPLARQFGATPVAWEERHTIAPRLIVNTTPLGMHGAHENESPYDFQKAQKTVPPITGGTAYDIVYNPLETRFLREARAAGLACVSGREMFFAQGNAQFLRWTGQCLPETARMALNRALDAQTS